MTSLTIPFHPEFLRILVRDTTSPQTVTSSVFHRFKFTGGSNVTLEGSVDPHWGWVDSHGQQVKNKISIVNDLALTEFKQWWDVMEEATLRVNRPHGWAFWSITGGEIKYMKLWQVSADGDRLRYGGSQTYPSLACSLEF